MKPHQTAKRLSPPPPSDRTRKVVIAGAIIVRHRRGLFPSAKELGPPSGSSYPSTANAAMLT
jgi:hypothetical protein